MLKKISVDQLTLGMHLKEFCGSWMEHPFWRQNSYSPTQKDIELRPRQQHQAKSGSTSPRASTPAKAWRARAKPKSKRR
jgi:hypothetical protein